MFLHFQPCRLYVSKLFIFIILQGMGGLQGLQGPRGLPGFMGPMGRDGRSGFSGDLGEIGGQGPDGIRVCSIFCKMLTLVTIFNFVQNLINKGYF